MHPKKKNQNYTSLLSLFKDRMKKHGYTITTNFDSEQNVFSIKNQNTKTGKTIYFKSFGFRKDSEKDALISKAYEEYFIDMFEYGMLLNNESFTATTR